MILRREELIEELQELRLQDGGGLDSMDKSWKVINDRGGEAVRVHAVLLDHQGGICGVWLGLPLKVFCAARVVVNP